MVNELSDNDLRALQDLLDRIEAKPPVGSVAVLVMAGGDDRFVLTSEDQNGSTGITVTLPDGLSRFDYTSSDLAMEIKDLDFWPSEIAVIAE